MAISDIRIGQRLSIGFATVLGLLILVIAIALGFGRQLQQQAAQTQTYEQLASTASQYALLTQMQVGRIRIMVSGDASMGLTESIQAEWDAMQPELLEQQRLLQEGIVGLGRSEATDLLGKADDFTQQQLEALEARNKALGEGDWAQVDTLSQRWREMATASVQTTIELANWLETEAANTLAHAKSSARLAEQIKIGLGILAVALGAGIAFLLSRAITRPLSEAVELANHIANGELTHQIDIQRKDELGQLVQALNGMRNSLLKVVSDIRQASDGIGVAASEIAAGNQDLSIRTEQSASSLQETAASMEELTATVKQSAASAVQANQLASNATKVASEGGAVVGQVVHTMRDISQSSQRISDIIGVIDGIAFQTNILALNAAVEAARAGEQGRGFAVVAGEVRTLAQRSAQAAKEIKELINASVSRVTQGSQLVEKAGSTMQEIVTSVQQVTEIVGEISTAAAEQSDGIGQINVAIAQLDQMTQQNAALVEQSAAAAKTLSDQADRLVQTVAVFRTGEYDLVATREMK